MTDLHEMGARVLSVFGPFGSRTLVEMPTEVAQELFPDGLAFSGRTDVVAAAEADVEAIRARDESLAGSSLAASMIAMAYEVAHPFNSATSKSMCVRAMNDALAELWAQLPAEEQEDELERRRLRRVARLAGQSAAGAPTPS